MIHPDTELKLVSPEVGLGVFATKLLPKGTVTWVQDKLDRVYTPMKADNLGEEYQNIIEKYAFRNNKGEFVLCWDNSRYVNHSFNSNCITTPYNFEIAVRDIFPGEELTDDYGYLNVSEPFYCLAEEGDRQIVYPDDLLKFSPQWDNLIKAAMKDYAKFPQALSPFLNESLKKKLHNISIGKKTMESILTCYFERKNSKSYL
jgi:hypothetical protein